MPWGPADKRLGFGPRYRAAAKLDGRRAALAAPGDRRMLDWKLTNDAGRPVRLVICGFDYERLREVFFRTHPEPPSTGGRLPVPSQEAVTGATFAQAVHASSNAPVSYFDAPAKFGPGPACFWDGAMGGYNNPLLAGVVEAVRDGTVERRSVRALSVGTGSVVLPEQVRNQPIRASRWLKVEIGHGTFGAAKEAWSAQDGARAST